jgi:hypothetical protein
VRRPVTLLATGLVVLGEAGLFGYLYVLASRVMTAPMPCAGGTDGCTSGRYMGLSLIQSLAIVGLVLFALAVRLVVCPGAISWTFALLVQCSFLDAFALAAVGRLLMDPTNHRFVADLGLLFQRWWLWSLPSAGLFLLFAPRTLATCFRISPARAPSASDRT